MGHASPSTTLNIYAHMFDEARHAADIRTRMARSAFAGLLENEDDERKAKGRGPRQRVPRVGRVCLGASGCSRAVAKIAAVSGSM